MYLPFFQINESPLVVSTILDMGKSGLTEKVIQHFYVQNKKPFYVVFLYHCVELSRPETALKIKSLFHSQYIILANTEADCQYLLDQKIPCIYCHQNCFLDSQLFDIQKTVPKYNAVYIAQASRYKRIELATDVESLAIISYSNTNHDDYDEKYVQAIEELPSVINKKIFLSDYQVSKSINQAKCGLILSAFEGANFATTEYLLCGIPIVSIPSYGGRDVFFDSYNHVLTQPDKYAIKKAVEYIVSKSRDRQKIRQDTLQKMNDFRTVFNNFIHHTFPSVLLNENGLYGSYTNKLMTWNLV